MEECFSCGRPVEVTDDVCTWCNAFLRKNIPSEYFIALLDATNRTTLYWNDGSWEQDIDQAVSWTDEPWDVLLEIRRQGEHFAYVAILTDDGTEQVLENNINLSEKYPIAGKGLAASTPQWVQEKRMDLFSRSLCIAVPDICETRLAYALWALNEFDKFFETGLAKADSETMVEPEPSKVQYKVVVENEDHSKEDGIYIYTGFVCVTVDDKQTIVNDMPIKGEGIEKMVAMQNFNQMADEVIEQLKLEERFE